MEDEPRTARASRAGAEWYRLECSEVLGRLDVDPAHGLPAADVAARAASHGPNRLPRRPRRSRWGAVADQFRSSLVAVLVVAAVLAAVIGDVRDALVIGVVVVVNAGLGLVQEHRAESSMAALERMVVTRAQVRRDATVAEIDAADLVPGDVVLLDAGDRVPADGRWIEAVDVEVDESALTGESMPVAKSSEAITAGRLAVADRRNMAYTNTGVTGGRGAIVVTATGSATEIGRLAALLTVVASPPTPLQRDIAHLVRRLTAVAGLAVALVAAIGLATGAALEGTLLSAVALAVATIPEGLPAVLTVTLAVGTAHLARHRAIVKRLVAVETLGAVTVIGSDKTGTLTTNEMSVRVVRTVDGVYPIDPSGPFLAGDDLTDLLTVCALCNDATPGDGDGVVAGEPTEVALVALAARGGIDAVAARRSRPRLGEVPFESTAKYMATFHAAADGGVDVLVKGAPDVVLERCHRVATASDGRPIDDSTRRAIAVETAALGDRGLRVLAMASGHIAAAHWDPSGDLRRYVGALCWHGTVGLADPPRAEARAAIGRCRQAGIDVKMITGDHASTAAAIAAELDIPGELLTGDDLDRLTADELAARIEHVGVFARVGPEHKLGIVEALQRRRHVVAMTGDGVNDAPALKQADVGVAMGRAGTDVAREAASVVLTDDNFATIVEAVESGRAIYDNIVKFVTFQLSTNIGAILTIATATLLGWPGDGRVLFAPLAIFWVNIIVDGPPAMALGVDPAGPGTMARPPRAPTSRILTTPRLARIAGSGTIMTVGTLLAYRLTVGGGAAGATGEARGAAVALTTFVFFQVFNLHNSRFPDHSVFTRHALRNWRLWAASAAVVVLQVTAITWERSQRLFTGRDVAAPLGVADVALAAVLAATILLLEEARKLVR